jgi:hypothetical protein
MNMSKEQLTEFAARIVHGYVREHIMAAESGLQEEDIRVVTYALEACGLAVIPHATADAACEIGNLKEGTFAIEEFERTAVQSVS